MKVFVAAIVGCLVLVQIAANEKNSTGARDSVEEVVKRLRIEEQSEPQAVAEERREGDEARNEAQRDDAETVAECRCCAEAEKPSDESTDEIREEREENKSNDREIRGAAVTNEAPKERREGEEEREGRERDEKERRNDEKERRNENETGENRENEAGRDSRRDE